MADRQVRADERVVGPRLASANDNGQQHVG